MLIKRSDGVKLVFLGRRVVDFSHALNMFLALRFRIEDLRVVRSYKILLYCIGVQAALDQRASIKSAFISGKILMLLCFHYILRGKTSSMFG
jgi:hypothetical protein